MKNDKNKRETFSSTFAVFFATLSSAIGLGNIWKFPYLAGDNGGGAFVFIYLICVFLLGMPIMIGEFYIGRKSRKNAVGAFSELKANKAWSIIGYMGAICGLTIVFYYSSVAGWVYSYLFKSIKGDFSVINNMTASGAIEAVNKSFEVTQNGYNPMMWQFIVLLVVSIVLVAGVKNGIEKFTKFLMPILFILIIICDIKALTLPEAKQGLSFLFHPDFSKVTIKMILTALGLAFFKLGVGLGALITYGSYFTRDTKLIGTSFKVAFGDTLISLMAGIAIFPVVFSFGLEPSAGPGLLFKIIPLSFSKLPFGNLLLVAFFLLTSIAATTAMISMVEVAAAILKEELNFSRALSVVLPVTIAFIVGALTVHPSSMFSGVHLFGKNFFDFFDFLTMNIMLPLGGLLIAIFIGYNVKKEDLISELSNEGTLNNERLISILRFIIRYISPVLIIIVFLASIGIIK